MTTTDQELKYSEMTRVCGQDEQHAVDVRQGTDGIRRLDVRAQLSVSPGVGLPLLDGSLWNLAYVWTEVVYPSNWQTLFVRNSAGILHGFHIDSDTDKLEVRLLINGVEKLIIDVKTIKDLDFQINQNQQYQSRALFCTGGDDFDFSPSSDMYFSGSMEIQVRRTDLASLKVKRWFVQYSEVSS
jgi:hypothetical protein